MSDGVPLLQLDDPDDEQQSFEYGLKSRKKGYCGNLSDTCMKIGNIVENKGSYARDHLANERTFLAWLRTAVSTIGLGVAIAKFGSGEKSKEAGLIFIFLGTVFLCYSTARYYYLYFLLKRGLFSPNAAGLIFVLLLCFLSAALTAAIVLSTG